MFDGLIRERILDYLVGEKETWKEKYNESLNIINDINYEQNSYSYSYNDELNCYELTIDYIIHLYENSIRFIGREDISFRFFVNEIVYHLPLYITQNYNNKLIIKIFKNQLIQDKYEFELRNKRITKKTLKNILLTYLPPRRR